MAERFSLQPLGANLPQHTTVGEDDLQAAFRASATSIVELLRAGQRARERAYHAGMSAALDDIVSFLQQGLDHHQPDSGLESLLNYIEARQTALRAAESDESEDERPQPGPSRPRSAPVEPPRREVTPANAAAETESPGPRTRSQGMPPSSPAPIAETPATLFTFDCPPPRSTPRRAGRTPSARAVVLEAAASVAGVKRGLPSVDEAVDVRMDEEPLSRPSKRQARRTG